MLFSSLQFCAFFVIVTGLYFLLPWRHRWKMLLFASCVFYMAFVPIYILILFATIVIDYWMGIKIAAANGRARRVYLAISIVATCLVLFVFKYYNFFAITTRDIQSALGFSASFPLAEIILPIGLSFHTFQSLSYVIEVFRGKQAPEHNFGIYALYVMFYPQLVAGPIERPQNLLHQFYKNHRFDLDNFSSGLLLIAWGFFQKMVIADRAAVYVNEVYGHWRSYSGLTLIVASLLFTVQIYADFSGYSTIAIGCARVMGFRLMRNFNRPYFACSLSEFWQRWHISLSTWFRDYLYIPLGGNRVPKSRYVLNILLTFMVSGLWHGANWTFIVWGAYHGVLLAAETLLRPATSRIKQLPAVNAGRRVLVVSLSCIGWVFFRSAHLSDSFQILSRMASVRLFSGSDWIEAGLAFTGSNTAFAVGVTTLVLIVLFFSIEWMLEIKALSIPSLTQPSWNRSALATVALCQGVFMFGVLHPSAFIYFQF